ncbi:MAG: hypothetical protein P8Y60_17540 [Calditrichota bacterium]
MSSYRIKIGLILILLIPIGLQSQSVYSRVGVGEITLPQSSRTAGLGIYGVATEDYNQISLINPASWYMPRLTAITMKVYSNRYSSSSGGRTEHFGFDGFNFHFPIGQSIGFGLGYTPYSNVRYDFARTDSILIAGSGSENYLQYNLLQQGRGGVGGNFVGLGVKLSDHVAVGAAFNFLFGEIHWMSLHQHISPAGFSLRAMSLVIILFLACT